MNRDSDRFKIRPITPDDAKEWARMRCELWPDGASDHATEIASFFVGSLAEPQAVLVASDLDEVLVAFVEISIRTDLAGLRSERVGYVEGLFIAADARGRGVARALLRGAQKWARHSGCTGFASDRADRLIVDTRF